MRQSVELAFAEQFQQGQFALAHVVDGSDDHAMNLPISTWGIIIGVLGIVALVSGAWLLLRARDVARVADSPSNELAPGRQRRPSASRGTVRLILVVNLLATIGALALFALVATRTIGSPETQTDPYAQRP